MYIYMIVGLAVLVAIVGFVKYGSFIYTERYTSGWAPNKDYLNMVQKVNKK